MTSRPSLGVSQRQPQPQAQVHPHNPSQSQPPRSLNPPSISASGLSQRPPSHQRSLSQQHLQPQSQVLSPTRRADGTLDHSAAAAPATTSNTPQPSHQQHTPQNQIQSLSSPADPSVSGDASQSRFVNTPRRAGGSRLRLELANDGIDHAGFSESPQNPDPLSAARVFTPSRIMPPTNEPSEMGDMSPHTSRCQTADSNLAPLPMPPRRARFVVPISRTSSSKPAAAATTTAPPPSVRRDNRAKPYAIETPIDAPRYPNLGKAEPTGK